MNKKILFWILGIIGILIIGGGASGLVSAISSKSLDNEVIVLEKKSSCGKKILASGNGRCNYFNENQDIDNYHFNNEELFDKIITKNNLYIKDEVLDLDGECGGYNLTLCFITGFIAGSNI